MIKSITCHGFCEQLWFKNPCFAFLVNMVSMDAKIIFDLDSSFCLKYFLHFMTSQISLLEGAIVSCGITGNKKCFSFFLMVSLYWKVKNGRICSLLYVQD